MADQYIARVAGWYRWFAENEADGRSPLYAELSRQIASDTEVFLAGLPRAKQQPHLLLATVRSLFGTAKDWNVFRSQLLGPARSLQGGC